MNPISKQIDMVPATGDLTQLFPTTVTPGISGNGYGTRRKPCDGNLYRLDVHPTDGAGGTLQIWDVAGNYYGATDNVNTGETITNAFLLQKIVAKEAKLIWEMGFNGDEGPASKIFATKIPFAHGLAVRVIAPPSVDLPACVQINANVDNGFVLFEGVIP